MINQRKIALDALIAVGENYGYSNIVLNNALQSNGVSNEDKPFITALFYGVLDRRMTVDYCISRFLKKPLEKMAPVTLNALRLAVFQLLFMDRVPQSAAVNESVNLVKNSKERYNAAFTNAVLRSFLRNKPELPGDNSVSSLKIRYSCPEWIIESFINDYGTDETVVLLEHFLSVPKITVRVNTSAISETDFISALSGRGINVSRAELGGCVILDAGTDTQSLEEYKNGLFHVQDIPSQTAVKMLDIRTGDRVLDMCASPGGKSFTAAQYALCGQVVSCDIHENRVKLISDGAARLNLSNVTALVRDSRVFDETLGKFDKIICDAPCSGLGVIRRKPEIKYKKDIDLSLLQKTQREILNNAVNYLKDNGALLYSTCTLRRGENEETVDTFLESHSGFEKTFEHTFLPSTDSTDGFYCAVIKRR